MQITNVSQKKDAYYDTFPIRFHFSHFGFVMEGDKTIRRNMAKEWGMELLSCTYGENSVDGSVHPRLLAFERAVEEQFGEGAKDLESAGFHFSFEGEEDGRPFVYFICTGNNGQEINAGAFLSDSRQFESVYVKEWMQALDRQMLSWIKNLSISAY